MFSWMPFKKRGKEKISILFCVSKDNFECFKLKMPAPQGN